MSFGVNVSSLHRRRGTPYPAPKRSSNMSFVLATRWASEQLGQTLRVLATNSHLSNELVLVCDCPSWETVRLLDEMGLPYHIVEFGHYFLSCNFGAKVASRDYVGFLQDDVIVGPGWDQAIESVAGENTIACVPMIDGIGIQAMPNYNLPSMPGAERTPGIDIAPLIGFNPEDRSVDVEKFSEWCRINSNPNIFDLGCLPYLMPREAFLTDPFLCHGPQGWGHEIDMITRWVARSYTVRCSFASYTYHRGTNGASTDSPVRSGERLNECFRGGVRYCKNCGSTEDGFPVSENEEYRAAAISGEYRCANCR